MAMGKVVGWVFSVVLTVALAHSAAWGAHHRASDPSSQPLTYKQLLRRGVIYGGIMMLHKLAVAGEANFTGFNIPLPVDELVFVAPNKSSQTGAVRFLIAKKQHHVDPETHLERRYGRPTRHSAPDGRGTIQEYPDVDVGVLAQIVRPVYLGYRDNKSIAFLVNPYTMDQALFEEKNYERLGKRLRATTVSTGTTPTPTDPTDLTAIKATRKTNLDTNEREYRMIYVDPLIDGRRIFVQRMMGDGQVPEGQQIVVPHDGPRSVSSLNDSSSGIFFDLPARIKSFDVSDRTIGHVKQLVDWAKEQASAKKPD